MARWIPLAKPSIPMRCPLQALYLHIRNSGQSFSHELRVYRPDGKLRDISVLGRMHRDDDGTPISLSERWSTSPPSVVVNDS